MPPGRCGDPVSAVRRLLIANHRWWYPTLVNGQDVANHEFARRLARSGVEVRVHGMVAPLVDGTTRQRSYFTDGVKVSLVQSDFIRCLSATIEDFRPDVVMTSSPEGACGGEDIHRMMSLFDHYGIPVVLYVHTLHPVLSLFRTLKDQLAAVVTNSNYMAEKITETWNRRAEVIYPVPSSRTFRVSEQSGPFITFFNPLPHKGLHIVQELVSGRFKHRSFLFVEGFMEPESYGVALVRSGNVVHARRSPDVAAVYLMTNMLLIPSQWEEPFGRVALEAMYNRIPVIASNTGGLKDSVGSGGLLIDDFTSVDAWADAIERMDDPVFREEIVNAGSRHIEMFSVEQQIAQFKEVFDRLV